MKIAIIGAGDVGFHIASELSKENHDVTVVEKNERRLSEVTRSIDVRARKGLGTDWQLLDDLHADVPYDALLALTDNDETNIVTATMAKHLGYPMTVARVHDGRLLNRTRLDFGHIFHIDHFICPELMVADKISKYIFSNGFHIERFAHGAVEMRTMTVPSRWQGGGKRLHELDLASLKAMIAVVHRVENGHHRTFLPHGGDVILPGDEITVIGKTDMMESVHEYFGGKKAALESVVIIGGTRTGLHLAKIMENRGVACRIVDRSHDVCTRLADELQLVTVIQEDGTDLDFLRSERVGAQDAIVACTNHDEVNLVASVMGKNVGAGKSVALLSSPKYRMLVEQLGISHAVSARLEAAHQILSFAKGERVTAMTTLYDEEVEVLEVNVPLRSSIAGIPISELGPELPSDFLIAVIQNRGRILIAHGNRILSPGDTVIVVCHRKARAFLEKVF